MMEIKKKLKMDILEKQNVQVVYAVQNDANSRKIEISLFAGGASWSIPSDVVVSVSYKKKDGTSGWYDKLPDGSSAVDVSDSKVTITLAPQVLTVPGTVKASVVFQDSETLDRIATFPMEIYVEEDPAAGKSLSNNYYKYKTLEDINTAIDSTKAYYIYIKEDGDENLVADKTFNDIRTHYYNGASLYAKYNRIVLPLNGEYSSDGSYVFEGTVNDNEHYRFTVYGDQSVDGVRTVLATTKAVEAAVTQVAEADYYDSFSVAIADINAGVRTGKCASGTGKVKVVTSNTGKVTVILLEDCYEAQSVTISADVDIALAGHTLSFTTAGAYLNFASGKCAIWGNVPGSRIINENLFAAEQVKLFSVLCERLEVHGGEYRMTGTIDKTSMMFQIARVNQYCLFEDCTVYSDIYSTGDSVTEVDGVTKVAGFYQFANITNTGGNTVVKGGSWSVCTSGNNRAVMFSNVGTLTAEGVAIEAEAVNHNAVAFMNQAATVGEEQKYGTFHIRNCAISVRTDADVIFNSFGVFNQYSGTVCHISDSTLFTDSRDFDPHEDGLGTWAVAIQNAVGATCYVTNVVAHGTHSCLSNQGKMYVNGGTYTGFCHGGIYCSHGADGEAFVNDAHLRDGHYEGIYPDHYETNKIHSVGGFYIGGGEAEICSNMSAYFDGCKIEGVYRAFVMRGSSGEQNNKAYLSNCEMIADDVTRAINIHNDTHRVYLSNCNYGKENATLPDCVIYTDDLYRKSANDKDVNAIVNHVNTMPKGGEIDPESIEDAVEKYLTENPPAGGGGECTFHATATADGTTHTYVFSEDENGNLMSLNEVWIRTKYTGDTGYLITKINGTQISYRHATKTGYYESQYYTRFGDSVYGIISVTTNHNAGGMNIGLRGAGIAANLLNGRKIESVSVDGTNLAPPAGTTIEVFGR